MFDKKKRCAECGHMKASHGQHMGSDACMAWYETGVPCPCVGFTATIDRQRAEVPTMPAYVPDERTQRLRLHPRPMTPKKGRHHA
jgi:hypothetical protein